MSALMSLIPKLLLLIIRWRWRRWQRIWWGIWLLALLMLVLLWWLLLFLLPSLLLLLLLDHLVVIIDWLAMILLLIHLLSLIGVLVILVCKWVAFVILSPLILELVSMFFLLILRSKRVGVRNELVDLIKCRVLIILKMILRIRWSHKHHAGIHPLMLAIEVSTIRGVCLWILHISCWTLVRLWQSLVWLYLFTWWYRRLCLFMVILPLILIWLLLIQLLHRSFTREECSSLSINSRVFLS